MTIATRLSGANPARAAAESLPQCRRRSKMISLALILAAENGERTPVLTKRLLLSFGGRRPIWADDSVAPMPLRRLGEANSELSR
jgi:hypothetical protein